MSVVIPAYNRERLLARALASVAAQRPRAPAEVLVVDDASTDGTAAVAAAAGARVISLKRNSGAAAARNAGVEEAANEWVALLDSDDEWLPHHLATLWPLRGGHVLVTGASMGRGEDPGENRVGGVPRRRPLLISSPAALVYPQNLVASSGVLIRRDALLGIGGYDAGLRHAEDFDLALRVLERGTGLATPAVVSVYHRHAGQKVADPAARATQHAIIGALASRPWSSPAQLERRRAVDAWDDLRTAQRAGETRVALRHAAALARRPSWLGAVAGILLWRAGLRRRSAEVAPDGGPVVATTPGGSAGRHGRPGAVRELKRGAAPGVLLELLLRPPGALVSPRRRDRAQARLAGVPVLRP